jgi:hypothetical protein
VAAGVEVGGGGAPRGEGGKGRETSAIETKLGMLRT